MRRAIRVNGPNVAGGNKSHLEHRWTFQLTQPAAWVFHVEAFHDSAVEEMAFQYSTDGSSWSDLLTVVNNSDQDLTLFAVLPAGLIYPLPEPDMA